MNRIMRICSIVVFAVEMVVGFPSNSFAIAVFVRKKPKTSTDILIIGRAIVDMIFVVTIPVEIARMVPNDESPALPWSNMLRTYVSDLLAYASLCVTFFTACDRYLVMCKPYGDRSSKQRSAIAMLTSISISIVLSIPMLVFGEISSRRGDDNVGTSSSEAAWMVDAWLKTVMVAVTAVGGMVFYGLVYRTLRRQARVQVPIQSGACGSNTQDTGHSCRDRCKTSKSKKRKSSQKAIPRALVMDVEPASPSMVLNEIEADVELDDTSECKTDMKASAHLGLSSKQENRLDFLPSNLVKTNTSTISTPHLYPTITIKSPRMSQNRSRHSESSATSPVVVTTDRHRQGRRSMSVSASFARPVIPRFTTNIDDSSSHPQCHDRQGNILPHHREPTRDRTMTTMLLVVTIVQVISWLPRVVFCHLEDVLNDDLTSEVNDVLRVIAFHLSILTHVIQYFIYLAVDGNVRRESKRLSKQLLFCCRQC